MTNDPPATRTIDDVLKDHFVTQAGRTRYPGQLPRDDEMMVAEIERLRTTLGQIARMKLFPDDVINRTTLWSAIQLAEAALKETTTG